MIKVLKGILDFFLSTRTALWLLMAQLVLFLAGAFLMPTMPEFESINAISLFEWLGQNPLSATWWLWASVAVLALLVANTVFCSVESIFKKRMNRHWILVISPQIIHIGFMLMLVAHLFSSAGASKGAVAMREGTMVRLTDSSVLRVKSLGIRMGAGGYPTDWRADIEYLAGEAVSGTDYLAPNKPSYHRGLWVYLKEVRPYPVKTGLFEINREPGAPWALAGGILFTVGTMALVVLKIRREQ